MRKFSSYGPIITHRDYHAPRTELIDYAYLQVIGEVPEEGGHYVTVWAPRQTGKSWVTRQVIKRVKAEDVFDIGVISMQSAKKIKDDQRVLNFFVRKLRMRFKKPFPFIETWEELSSLFTSDYFDRPMILIIDEFDALQEEFINSFANEFRNMYLERMDESDLPSGEKNTLLHGLALIGVRSVLGIENVTGSPFNVQRSIHIPNLNKDEVTQIFQDYQNESGQRIAPEVVERIYNEFLGQPGLTCWMGELLTEVHNQHHPEITMGEFNKAYALALKGTPNNNILNIISKAKMPQYTPLVLDMFKTSKKLLFRYDDSATNFLYMNGVVDHEFVAHASGLFTSEIESGSETPHITQTHNADHFGAQDELYLRFPSPFVQKRLFNYFSHQLFPRLDRLHDPFLDLSNIITDTMLHVPNMLRVYEAYVQQNRSWLFRNAPRRETDDRIFEAVYHFNFYAYLLEFLRPFNSALIPEFPTGNGKIDLIIRHHHKLYPLELKSFASQKQYQAAVTQAVTYGQRLNVSEVWVVFFVEVISDEQRAQYEVPYQDAATGVLVHSVFVSIL